MMSSIFFRLNFLILNLFFIMFNLTSFNLPEIAIGSRTNPPLISNIKNLKEKNKLFQIRLFQAYPNNKIDYLFKYESSWPAEKFRFKKVDIMLPPRSCLIYYLNWLVYYLVYYSLKRQMKVKAYEALTQEKISINLCLDIKKLIFSHIIIIFSQRRINESQEKIL